MRAIALSFLVIAWASGTVFAQASAPLQGDGRNAAELHRAAVERRDEHSFGNPRQMLVKHVDLDLTVDFLKKELRGSATLKVERQSGTPSRTPLILDSRDLMIEGVTAGASDTALSAVRFEVAKPDRILGSSITIHLPPNATLVRIAYHTAPSASALQWLDPPRTAGGTRPFLFTQSQAIHARSWIPLQDSPGVRVTYRATIRVPQGLAAVMSADRKGQQGDATRFEMTQAIPAYLIALAVGDLVFRPLGPRTGVWAEPSVILKAAAEFEDTERMVRTAENRFGPYRWGRYDILVLPPSFPFGGMENAKLTFATPTVLAGDRSLVSLVAHELAHSWSGNLVTAATWRDFWLNEGMTTYIERRIIEDLYGPERASMEAVLGVQELREELAKFDSRDEILHIDLKGRDPDDGMTRVPYEKGALFLKRLEQAAGREKFDNFLKAYFDQFAFQCITTADFEHEVRSKLFPVEAKGVEAVNLHLWLHSPGLSPDAPVVVSDRFVALDKLAQRWLDGEVSAKELNAANWSTLEWLHFLRALPAKLPSARMAQLDSAYALTDKGNSEIVCQWLLMGIRAGYAPTDNRLEDFLSTIGRRKYLRPLYEELAKTPQGKTRARAIYAKARPFYHPISTESVDRILK